jgi:hypothetical protein
MTLRGSGNGPAGLRRSPRFFRDLRPADLLAHPGPAYYQAGQIDQVAFSTAKRFTSRIKSGTGLV